MKLVKRKAAEDLNYLLKEDITADFVHANWLNIKDENNTIIGTITGYRLNIPLILNDIIRGGDKSAFELDAISGLCSNLWHILKENIEVFKDKSGELFFLNRLELQEINKANEKKILEMLKDKYGFIIYSLGQTELFDDFDRTWIENEYEEYKDFLISTGWENIDSFFLFENSELTTKKGYPKNEIKQDDFDTPFEDWIKNKGVNWINSLWQGIIKQRSLERAFSKISELQKRNVNKSYLDAIKFMKDLKITDFKQIDPRKDYMGEPPSYAKSLRSEAIYATYKKKKYMIRFWQDIDDNELMEMLSFGTYDKEFDGYCIGCEELFEDHVESWTEIAFDELFNRCYFEYLSESNSNNSPHMDNLIQNNPKIILFEDIKNRKTTNN